MSTTNTLPDLPAPTTPTTPSRAGPRRSLVPAVTALALAVAACGDDADDPAAAPQEPTTTVTETETVEPSPDETSPSDDPADPGAGNEAPATPDRSGLGASCTLDEAPVAVTVAHPDDWDVGANCTAFDPVEVPEDSDAFAISVRAVAQPFTQLVDGAGDAEDRQLAVVDGRQAVRTIEISELSNGPRIVWRVDLDPGMDEGAGTLVASADNAGVVVPGVLDQMMAELQIAGGEDVDGTIVARSEGGGTPYTVLATPDGCLQLFAAEVEDDPLDEACPDVAGLADAAAVAVRLSPGDEPTVVAGFAGDSVTAVTTEGLGVDVRVVAADAGRGFGFLAGSDDDELVLLAGDGARIGSATVG